MAKVLSNVPKYSGRLFDWRGGEGIADASELSPIVGGFFSRVYEDACDLGFIIVSHKTGAEKLFTLFYEDRACDHDELRAWHFKSDDGIKVIVFND